MAPLRHAILGVGGVGGLIGACLARSGETVTVVVRPESLAQYPEQVHLESAFGNFSVPVARADEVPPAVKNYTKHAWHLYSIQLNTDLLNISRNDFIEALKAENIGTS